MRLLIEVENNGVNGFFKFLVSAFSQSNATFHWPAINFSHINGFAQKWVV